MLALSFLILIGVMLVAEGIGTHFDKGYIYFAMAFALAVEFLNLKEEDIPGLGKQFGVPLGRVGTPEDIAPAVVYLASDASSWMTGHEIVINGGL